MTTESWEVAAYHPLVFWLPGLCSRVVGANIDKSRSAPRGNRMVCRRLTPSNVALRRCDAAEAVQQRRINARMLRTISQHQTNIRQTPSLPEPHTFRCWILVLKPQHTKNRLMPQRRAVARILTTLRVWATWARASFDLSQTWT